MVPNILTSVDLTEVKNAAAIGDRDAVQIAAEAGLAAVRGLEMNLLIRPGMKLSRIGALVTSGEITVMNIPGIAAMGSTR